MQTKLREVSEERLQATEQQSRQIISDLAGRLGEGAQAARSREETLHYAAQRFALMQGEFNAELQTTQLALEESNARIRTEALGVIGAADRRHRETVEVAETRHKQIVEETRAKDEEAKRLMQQAFAQRERELKTEISNVRRAELRARYEMTEAEAAKPQRPPVLGTHGKAS